MPMLAITHYPEPILRRKSQPIHNISSPEVQTLIDAMIKTMYGSPKTIGLAAPQVGHAVQLIVVDVSAREKKHGLLALINPVLVWGREEKVLREGCLSLPDYTGNVTRYNHVLVRGLDREGAPFQIETDGMEAICLQHEIDHINGMMFIDRVTSLTTDVFRRKRYGKA